MSYSRKIGFALCALAFCSLDPQVIVLTAAAQPATGAAAAPSAELTGLWRAIRRFGPDERGPLVLERTNQGWTADFLGRRIPVRERDGVLDFALPGDRGSFRARLNRGRGLSGGQWFQPGSAVAPPYGSTIRFRADGRNRWRGDVVPWDDHFTLYLMVERQSDGTLRAFIRNPERNMGHISGVERLERDGTSLRLLGRAGGRGEPRVVASGVYDPDNEVIRLDLPRWGGSYDFRREGDDSDFWPRGRNPGRYVYRPPLARDDGWPVATLEDENIDRRGIEAFVQMILNTPMDSANAHEVHGILVARHGRLVLEEYFHGNHRDGIHGTRSAAKSITAVLAGAAIQAGLPIRLNDPIYRVMNGGRFPDGLDSRRRAMTLEHLLTMSSGIHCDDSDPDAPGNEERLTDQTDDPDYWRLYMSLPMDRTPGERSIYCSGDPNLAIGVLTRATGEQAMDLFDRLVAGPLQMSRHAWFVSPSLQPYGGGSVQLLPRDFLKFGQLMLDGGTWHGRRILSRAFVERASASRCPLNRIGYGYLWWSMQVPYRGRQVRVYFAGGNGGQGALVVPELDLAVATLGGSYNSRAGLEIQQGYLVRHILPAVREPGDAPAAPATPQPFELVYGLERPAPPCPAAAFLPPS